MAEGKVIQVIGLVVDVQFPERAVPEILNAVKISYPDKHIDLTLEVEQLTGNNTARCISLGSTDGLVRGMVATDLGKPISVPVGEQTLGRIFNLLGEPIDGIGPVAHPEKRAVIHRDPPSFEEQVPVMTMLETGIKVIDLLALYPKGGKIGLFGGAGVGKTVLS